jgi:hypothetical protein
MTAREFGPYRLLARLGAGPLGEVWRALDTRADREVAVKVLPAWVTATEGGKPWFHLQAMKAAGLNAPNIIPIHDYGFIGRQMFIEMPLIAGIGLDALVDEQGPLDPARAVGLIEQIAVALDTAHAAGLVHHELTPSSALIVNAGRSLGGDFIYLLGLWDLPPSGTAEIVNELSTLAYLAPERIDSVCFPSGDVYALACVLFQALTGRAPFVPPAQASEGDFYLDAHRHRPPPAASAYRAALPRALDDVIARGMAKDPGSRFSSAGALATAAVRAAVRSPPVDASSAAPIGNRRLTGHADVVTAVAAAQVDGRPVAVSGSFDTTVRIWDLVTGRPVGAPITDHAAPVRAVAVAQVDGRPVAISGGDDGTVRVWDLATREAVGLPFDDHTGPVFAVATTQVDGRPVVVSGSFDAVRVWDLATREPVGPPFTRHAAAVFAVAATRVDGRPVVVSGGSFVTIVWVWDPTTGEPVGRPFTDHEPGPVTAVAATQVEDQPVVVYCGTEATSQVWDLTTREPIGAPLSGHTDTVTTVTTAYLDGRPMVISGSHDGTVRVWDAATGQPVGNVLTGHINTVRAVAATQVHGRPVVISGGLDTTVRVWDLAAHVARTSPRPAST